MEYKNKFGTINLLEDSKFKNKTIAVAMSGGADSTMLCYLLANTIQEQDLNITIQPYNGLDLWAPGDGQQVPKIVYYIRNKFPFVQINWPLSVVFDTDEPNSGWIHCSYKAEDNRKQILRAYRNESGKTCYEAYEPK